MIRLSRLFSGILVCNGLAFGLVRAEGDASEESKAVRVPACQVGGDAFQRHVWPKVAARTCIKCHKAGGDAEDSAFVLLDPARDVSAGQQRALQHNRAAFAKTAKRKKGDEWLMLLKATGQADHDGGEVLKIDSPEYRILHRFVLAANGLVGEVEAASASGDTASFFDGVVMLEDEALLRRLTLSLSGRLPTEEELATVAKGGLGSLASVLDGVMEEEAFYERLAEGFNDIFLTRGYDGVPERALSYEHFSTTRHWTQSFDLSEAGDEAAQRRARYKLTDDYREAMLREPTEMIKYIVRNNRPFTEITTADYILVSPYTSRGYGIFDGIRDRFEDDKDPFEFIPVRLEALKNRDGRNHQESATGFYPHAGLLSMFQYLMRYPTTETNRNRLRARMYFQHFLGIDVMQLAPRVNDAAAITAKYEIPTMQASDCVVCHKVIDPIAGLFQDFYVVDAKGVYGRRKDGWFEDMFGAGFEEEALPAAERWRSLQWLGKRTAADPRFAAAMTEHVYYILTGKRPLSPPEDLSDPHYDAKHRAYCGQRTEIEAISAKFTASNFDLKQVFQAWARSPWYRADGLKSSLGDPHREAELADVGLVRLLTPEQLERKIAAIFGKNWGRLETQFTILYGGINSKTVTERISDPSGAMGAIQRMMANEIACRSVSADISMEPSKRVLFALVERDTLPGKDNDSDDKIRRTIVHLHQRLLGQTRTVESEDVERTYQLFAGIIADAKTKSGVEPREIYFCRGADDKRLDDPHYTIRAWRAVVAYLLRQQAFLYE